MRIVGEAKAEGCLDTGPVREYLLDGKLTSRFLECLGRFGELTVLGGGVNPMFTLEREYYFTVKGIVGGNTLKVSYRGEDTAPMRRLLNEILEECSDGGKNNKS